MKSNIIYFQRRGPAHLHTAWGRKMLLDYIAWALEREPENTPWRCELLLHRAATLSAYSRYRLLHHLVKLRARRSGQTSRFLLQSTDAERQQAEALLPQFLAAPAFELNLLALYAYRVLGRTTAPLRTLVAEHCRQGCEPVRNALAAASAIPTTAPAPAADAEEPDAISEPY